MALPPRAPTNDTIQSRSPLSRCLVYELMTFLPPFTATNQIALAQKICRDKPAPLDVRLYSLELRYLALRMLEKDPARRPNVYDILRYAPLKV